MGECVRQWMSSLSFESESLCTVLSLQACESEARYAQLRLAAHRTRAITSCNLTHTAPSRDVEVHIRRFLDMPTLSVVSSFPLMECLSV